MEWAVVRNEQVRSTEWSCFISLARWMYYMYVSCRSHTCRMFVVYDSTSTRRTKRAIGPIALPRLAPPRRQRPTALAGLRLPSQFSDVAAWVVGGRVAGSWVVKSTRFSAAAGGSSRRRRQRFRSAGYSFNLFVLEKRIQFQLEGISAVFFISACSTSIRPALSNAGHGPVFFGPCVIDMRAAPRAAQKGIT